MNGAGDAVKVLGVGLLAELLELQLERLEPASDGSESARSPLGEYFFPLCVGDGTKRSVGRHFRHRAPDCLRVDLVGCAGSGEGFGLCEPDGFSQQVKG